MTGKRLFANLSALAVGKIASMLFGIVMLAMITRRLGPALYGQITLSTVFALVVAVIADAGVSMIIPRDLARITEVELRRQAAASIVTMGVMLHCLWSAIAMGIAFISFSGPTQTLALEATALLLLAGLFAPFATVGAALASAAHRQHRIAAAQIAGGLCSLASLGVLIVLNAPPYVLMMPYVLGSVATGATLMVLPKDARVRPVVDIHHWRTTLREGVPMLSVTGINTLYGKADVLILAAFTTSAVVGRYGLAYKVVDATITLPALLVLVVQPQMVRAHSQRRGFDRVMRGAMLAIQLLAVPMGIVLIRFARGVAILLGGYHFVGSATVMRILTIAVILTFPTAILSAGLITMGEQRRLVYTTSAAAATNIVGNVILIPPFGMLGAACALVVSESAVLAVFVWTYRKFASLPYPGKLRPVAIAAAGMLLIALAGPLSCPMSPVAELLVWGTVGTAVYAAWVWRAGVPQNVASNIASSNEDRSRQPPSYTTATL